MRLLITAGPTREYLDSVRFLSNPSSGKMGYAIADSAVTRGHAVTLVSGPVELSAPRGVELIRVVSAADMLAASLRAFELCDCAIMVAAVCDYRPVKREAKKLPKMREHFSIELEPTEDICATLGRIKGARKVIGFALEDHDHEAHAAEKLARKNCDAIVLNDLKTVNAEEAEIRILVSGEGFLPSIRGSKSTVAQHVLEVVERMTC